MQIKFVYLSGLALLFGSAHVWGSDQTATTAPVIMSQEQNVSKNTAQQNDANRPTRKKVYRSKKLRIHQSEYLRDHSKRKHRSKRHTHTHTPDQEPHPN